MRMKYGNEHKLTKMSACNEKSKLEFGMIQRFDIKFFLKRETVISRFK